MRSQEIVHRRIIMSESKSCYNDGEIFSPPSSGAEDKYRYFNQPIEQIPGWDGSKPQFLVHRPNCGLQWVGVSGCLDVVTCIKLEDGHLKAELRNIVVIKDFEPEDPDACKIETTDCPSS